MIDSHAHYDHSRFDCGRDNILQKMHEEGLEYCINPAIGYESNYDMMKKLDKYDWTYYAVGLHPNCVNQAVDDDDWHEQQLRELLSHKKVVAVGETGLDSSFIARRFLMDVSDEYRRLVVKRQIEWFHRLIGLSIEADLPLILHVRGLHKKCLEILDEYKGQNLRGVIHCYNYDTETAWEYINRGFKLGIGGMVTRESKCGKLRDCVRDISMEHILLETDSPFLIPQDVAGKRNSSANIPVIAKTVADLKGMSVEEVIMVSDENIKKMFKIG